MATDTAVLNIVILKSNYILQSQGAPITPTLASAKGALLQPSIAQALNGSTRTAEGLQELA